VTKLAVVCALAITTLQAQTPVTPARASTARGEWPTYSGDLAGTKYSPLDQITRDNFSTLRIAWRTKSPDSLISVTMPGGGEWAGDPRVLFDELSQRDPDRWRDGQAPYVVNYKATPLMVNGVLYLNSPASVGAALDARTGAVKWIFNPKSYEAGTTTMSLRWNQRGVAYWTDGKEERVYWGTGDGYLIAVDAKSGRPIEQFGTNGRVDLMDGLPRAKRGARDFLNALTYSVQSPPIVVGDLVVTPASISSLVNAKEQIPGWVRAFDARTGAVKWTFHTIPQTGQPGYDTWQGGSAEYSGKVSVWTVMSADESLGHLYLPTNTVAPDFYGGHRLGNNLYAESLVAVDIQTGTRVWHFQTVHHGLWDYDNPSAPNLIDLVVDGVPVKAVAQISKQGFIYTFNRVTGAPIWPIEERAVPASDVIGEHASPTQPIPTKPAPFEQQGVTVDQLVDFTPAIRAMAVEAVQPFRLGPIYTPPTLEGTITRPFTVGGGNWSGAAVDPETGMLYVPSRNGFGINRIAPPEPATNSNLRYIQTPGRSPQMPQGLPLLKPPYSRLTAIDMNRGEHAWMIAAGAGDRIRQHPLLRDLNLPPLGGDSTLSGPLLTKTLLIYALTTGGTGNGPRLVAYDKATGRELGSADLPGAAIGTPMTYLVAGKQYIALTVQGATPRELPELVALTLP